VERKMGGFWAAEVVGPYGTRGKPRKLGGSLGN